MNESFSIFHSPIVNGYIYTGMMHTVGGCIGLAKKFVQVFTYDVTEKIKRTLWPTVYVGVVTWQRNF